MIGRLFRYVAAALAVGVIACGGGNGGSNTSSTPTSPTSQNHAPTISIASTSSFGIAQLSSFTFNAATADADGDPVSVSWNLGDGTAATGNSTTHIYTNGGTMNVVGTATDTKGAQGTGSTTVTVGSMTGSWLANVPICGTFNLSLTQTGGTVTGTFVMPSQWCNVPGGSTGKTDPAEPGTIDAQGNVQIRLKIGIFLDSYFRGQMDGSGRVVNGGMFQSGFSGQAATLTKQ